MNAVRWHARGDVRYEWVPDPLPPGEGELRVEVAYCGLCGSDVHEYTSGPAQIPTSPHPLTGCSAPIVLGHEVSGRVSAVGAGVDLAIGTAVVLNALEPCGRCDACVQGALERCEILGHIGISADGGLAESLNVPLAMVVPLPDGISLDVAALAEPFAVAAHALGQAGYPRGQTCAVLGAGAIGLATALLLRDLGNVVVIGDSDSARLQIPAALGFEPLDYDTSGYSTVFECAGAPGAVRDAIQLTASGGLTVLAGLPIDNVEIDVRDLVLREVRLIGSVGHLVDPDLTHAVRFLADHATEARALITAVIPLQVAVSQGLDLLAGPGRNSHVKVLVEVFGEAGAATDSAPEATE